MFLNECLTSNGIFISIQKFVRPSHSQATDRETSGGLQFSRERSRDDSETFAFSIISMYCLILIQTFGAAEKPRLKVTVQFPPQNKHFWTIGLGALSSADHRQADIQAKQDTTNLPRSFEN